MKKGVVVLLVVAALVILITPGIIGRLAEESIDQNIELAVTENEDVVVSSLGFVRGWFTSEGQHRIELRDKTPLTDAGDEDEDEDGRRYLDALIVTTRIDHGLIPVTSMARDEGSLAPGLGSAVSTLSGEVSDGTTFDIPGRIFSEIGLTGELQSNFVLEADSADAGGRLLEWGDADVLVTSDPASGMVAAAGTIGALAVTTTHETVRIGAIEIDAEQRPSQFGFPLGALDLRVDSLSVQSVYNDIAAGPLVVETTLDATGDRVDVDARVELANFSSQMGDAEITVHKRIRGADGYALQKVISLRQYPGEPDRALAALDEFGDGVVALLAGGMELHVDRFDLQLPQGAATATLHLLIHESDPDPTSWAAMILALDGTLELGITQGLVDWITAQFPDFKTIVALGYLRQSGDLYETLVEIRSGVLTINGAPMQIPLDAFQ